MEHKPAHRVNLDVVLEQPPLRIRYLPGTGDEMVLAFAGVGRTTDPEEEPGIQFYRVASGAGTRHVLFITDQSRSWLNHGDIAEQIADFTLATQKRTGARRITALGNSMGGTMALLMARFLALDAVLAIVPQYSVDPAIMPDEPSWKKLRNRIGHFRFAAVDHVPPTGQYFVLHGTLETELLHAMRFPIAANLHHFIFAGADHNLGIDLKNNGHASALVESALAGEVEGFATAALAAGAVYRADFTGVSA